MLRTIINNHIKLANSFLDRMIPMLGNELSYVAASFSKKTVSTPISIDEANLRLREISLSNVSERTLNRFLEFCYPNTETRTAEIEQDKRYWDSSSTFIVLDELGELVGCVQFISKTNASLLPIEYSFVVENNDIGTTFDVDEDSGYRKSCELYRLRRTFDVNRRTSVRVSMMIFKAIWAKVIQTKTCVMYLTCDPDQSLVNLYGNRLAFEQGPLVTYDKKKVWRTLKSDCCKREKELARVNRRYFDIQTYFRRNLRQSHLDV